MYHRHKNHSKKTIISVTPRFLTQEKHVLTCDVLVQSQKVAGGQQQASKCIKINFLKRNRAQGNQFTSKLYNRKSQ